jgi:AbrB family looped-hinge helix DNA binding protein
MRTAIDASGRLIVPKQLRDQVGLEPGQQLEIFARDGGLVIEPIPTEVTLVRRDKRLVAEPTEPLPKLTQEEVRAAIARIDAVVSHRLLETFSVLTRLPAPHRMAPEVVGTYLEATFGSYAVLALTAPEQRKLVTTCAAQGVGAIYDALIGATCSRSRCRLLTLDSRARPTYAVFNVDHELLA